MGASLHGGNGGFRCGKRGHHDDLGIGTDALGLGQDGEPVHVGHAQIGDDHVERAGLDGRDGLASPRGCFDAVTLAAQVDPEELAHRALVVNDQDVPVVFGHGMRLRATRMRKPPKLRTKGRSQARRSAQSKSPDRIGRLNTRELGVTTRTPRIAMYSTSGGR